MAWRRSGGRIPIAPRTSRERRPAGDAGRRSRVSPPGATTGTAGANPAPHGPGVRRADGRRPAVRAGFSLRNTGLSKGFTMAAVAFRPPTLHQVDHAGTATCGDA